MLDKRYKYFLAAATQGSFQKAASSLYISQPALSKQIAQLEAELGCQLFDRSGYRPVLTEKGRYLYTELQRIQKECDEVLMHLKETQKRNLKVGITGAFENRKLMKIISQSKEILDPVEFTFIKGTFQQCLDRLKSHQIDFCIGIDSMFSNIPGIETKPLENCEMCLICSFDHPLANRKTIEGSELNNERWIVLDRNYGSSFYEAFMLSLEQDGIHPAAIKEVHSFDELVFSVSIGEGIAVVSKDVVRPSEVRILDLKDTHHSSSYLLAFSATADNTVKKTVKDLAEAYRTNSIT